MNSPLLYIFILKILIKEKNMLLPLK